MRITEQKARRLYDAGYPVRAVSARSGASRWGWCSAATEPLWRDFDKVRQMEEEHVLHGGQGIRWETPGPSHRTHAEAAGHIFRLEPFKIGNLSGTFAFTPWETLGDLPEEYRLDFMRADYAVWSYETPIAWTLTGTGTIIMPPVRYSLTTTQHQHLAAGALRVGFQATESARKGKGKTPYTHRNW